MHGICSVGDTDQFVVGRCYALRDRFSVGIGKVETVFLKCLDVLAVEPHAGTSKNPEERGAGDLESVAVVRSTGRILLVDRSAGLDEGDL